ncbi:hypothetical protein K456DRAFT_419378 [Colletotrichum gloeosporioides 23]|nr:hypothetical protein K456DRAFT_419378 [Colletotrichum gloeosporioides 23]
MGYVVGGGLIRRSDFLPTGSTAQIQRSSPTTKPPDLIAYILGMDSRSTDNIHSFASTFLCVVRGRRLYCFLVILILALTGLLSVGAWSTGVGRPRHLSLR